MRPPALVLFSGGQDSTTCLAWALERYQRVETIGFDYGQRHVIELSVRPKILDLIRTRFPKWGSRLGDDRVVAMRELAQLFGHRADASRRNSNDRAGAAKYLRTRT